MSKKQNMEPSLSTAGRSGIFLKLKDLFHLSLDTDREGAINSIKEGIEFRGNAVWALIIAVLIASIGLNVNSTAVIIGAMLISPLMGPIAGAGLALGIYDINLLKKSLYNLTIMTVISLLASWLYFTVSPLNGATTELVARTTPTFFDVLIAIFGGTALIISVSRKSRNNNTLAGVAIATALMPPICAAGYGLASKNLSFFLGAFYLYLINSVFIGLTTFIFTKYLKLRVAEPGAHKLFTKKNLILTVLVALLFITPSVFIAYNVIQITDFRTKAENFIEKNMKFANSQVLNINKINQGGEKTIEVTVVGAPLSPEMTNHLTLLLPEFGLQGTTLKIIQSNGTADAIPASDKQTIASQDSLESRKQIEMLQKELANFTDKNFVLDKTTKELYLLFPDLEKISFGDMLVNTSSPLESKKTYTVLVKWKEKADPATKTKLKLFLQLRLGLDDLNVVTF